MKVSIHDEKNITGKLQRLRALRLLLGEKFNVNAMSSAESHVFLNRALVSAGHSPIHLTVQFNLSIGCNARCIMCDKRSKGAVSGLTYRRLLKMLAFIDPVSVYAVKLFGGEPLLDKAGLITFLRACVRRGLRLHIVTNGSLLTPAYIDRLAAAGLSRITFSLDSPLRAEHDRIRGVPGLFERAVKNILYFRKYYPMVFVEINSVVMRETVQSLKEMIFFANRLGVQRLSFLYAEDFGKNFQAIRLRPDDYRRIIAVQRSAVARASKTVLSWDPCSRQYLTSCRLRYLKIAVNEDGLLELCGKYPVPARIFLDRPFAEILKEDILRDYFINSKEHCIKS